MLREIRRLLTDQDLVCLADSAHCPYGGKPWAEILKRAHAITRCLTERQAARQVQRVLQDNDLFNLHEPGAGTTRFFTTGENATATEVIRRLWGEPVDATVMHV